MKTIREEVLHEVPSKYLKVDFGQGEVVLLRTQYYKEEGFVVITSADPDLKEGDELPCVEENGKSFVIKPALLIPENFVLPEGFQYIPYKANLSDRSWRVRSDQASYSSPDNPFKVKFDLSYQGFPVLPFKHEFSWETEDGELDCLVDSNHNLWTARSAFGVPLYVVLDVSYRKDLPPNLREACNLPPLDTRPDWMIEAEKQGWTPPKKDM